MMHYLAWCSSLSEKILLDLWEFGNDCMYLCVVLLVGMSVLLSVCVFV